MTADEQRINACANPLHKTQRQKLYELSRVRKSGNYVVAPNKALDEYVAQLKDIYPRLFHTNETLNTRVFVGKPLKEHAHD